MKVYVDQGVNRKIITALRKEFGFEIVHVGHYEQSLSYAEDIPGVFMLDHSMLDGGDYLGSDDIYKVEEVMAVQKKSDRFDIAHIYSAFHAGCEYFVTNNPKDFIREVRNDPTSTARRQKLEGVLNGLRIVTLEEFATLIENS